MNQAPRDLLARVEGTLLDPGLTVAEADERLQAWSALGLRRVLTVPWLLGELDAVGHPTLEFCGAVAFPAGGATLANKRMEILECLRLGAKAVTVTLTPGLVLAAGAAALEKEMSALLTTAPELHVRFLVDTGRVAQGPMTVLLRLLSSCRPTHLATADGVYSEPAGPENVAWLRARLTRKVKIAAHVRALGPEGVAAFLAAGADVVATPAPELVAAPGGVPPGGAA